MSYYIEKHVPDLSGLTTGWVGHFTKALMTGTRGSYQYHALYHNFIRLVEASIQAYSAARLLTFEYWDSHDSVHISAYSSASSYLEICLTNVDRSMRHMDAILKSPESRDLNQLLPANLTFMDVEPRKRVRLIRNLIHHLEEKIVQGKLVPAKTFFLPVVNGPEIIRGSDTFKQLDRIEVGRVELLFVELASWLQEMAHCAKLMAEA